MPRTSHCQPSRGNRTPGNASLTGATKQYDLLNRLTNIANVPSADSAISFAYQYNSANQRTRITEADSSYWLYSYDSLGQVTSGKKDWSDGTPILGQQFEYTFDDIGNRKAARSGGSAHLLRTSTYAANSLNQYTERSVPGYLDVIGTATNTATVSVNGNATTRKDNYYRAELTVPNSSSAVWQAITNAAVLASGTNDFVTNSIGNLFLPKTLERFTYDLDGNLTSDGRWTNTWDAENRLMKVESLSGAPTASKRLVTWTHDYFGRRVRHVTEDGSSGSYVTIEDLKIVSDGWQNIAELNGTNNALIRSYVWGLDLSGSLTDAGGVGGLLLINYFGKGRFYAMDGSGNVAALVGLTDGKSAASYAYEPFGKLLRADGESASDNTFTFSTKRRDRTTERSLYEYRGFDAGLARWINRDPVGERGGKNLFNFVSNNPQGLIDPDGRYWWLIIPFILGGCSQQQCCECVTAVEITSATPYNNAVEVIPGRQARAIGHEVKYKVTVQYQKCAKSGTPSMQYIENTDSPPPFLEKLGMQPNKDFDTYGAVTADGGSPAGFEQWQFRNSGKKIPCSGTKSFEITDRPQIAGSQLVARSRTLSTRLVFSNPSGCASGTVSKGWVQNLGWDGTQVTHQELNSN